MQIKYSAHAKSRLSERKITKSEIILVLAEPDNKVYSDRSRIIANKRFKDSTLEVIYVIENNQVVIITGYHL